MPANSSIVLANGEATPVNHTFAPIGRDANNVNWYEDRSPRVTSTSALGFPRIGISVKRDLDQVAGQTATDKVTRVMYTIQLPTLESVGVSAGGYQSPPRIAYVDRMKGEFILPLRDGIADRKDIFAFNKNLSAHATLKALVEDLDTIWT